MENNLSNVPQEVTSDEKLLSLLSHLSIIFGGILLPLIIWITQKDKSKFVRFNALQAIFYHLAFTVIIIVYVFLMVIVMVVSGVGMGIFNQADHMGKHEAMPVVFIIIMVVFYAGIFVIAIGGVAYGIYVGVKAYHGDIKKIPFIGNIIYKKVYG